MRRSLLAVALAVAAPLAAQGWVPKLDFATAAEPLVKHPFAAGGRVDRDGKLPGGSLGDGVYVAAFLARLRHGEFPARLVGRKPGKRVAALSLDSSRRAKNPGPVDSDAGGAVLRAASHFVRVGVLTPRAGDEPAVFAPTTRKDR